MVAAEDDPDRGGDLVTVVVQPVRDCRVEGDRVAGAEHGVLEADLHAQLAGEHDPQLAAVVAHQAAVRAGGAPGLVDRVQELDVAVVPGGQPFPADARAEVDHVPFGGALDATEADRRPGLVPGRWRHGLHRPVAAGRREQLVERDAQLGDDRVERPHRRLRLAGLDLGHEARRDLEPASELAQAQATPLALDAQARAECVLAGLNLLGDALAAAHPLNSLNSAGSGNGAASAAASTSRSSRSTSSATSRSCSGVAPWSAVSRCSATSSGSRARHSSSSPGGRYFPGSLREWPTNRYVLASTNTGPSPRRTRPAASAAAACTAQTSIPSTTTAGISIASARATIVPAVTASMAVYSP